MAGRAIEAHARSSSARTLLAHGSQAQPSAANAELGSLDGGRAKDDATCGQLLTGKRYVLWWHTPCAEYSLAALVCLAAKRNRHHIPKNSSPFARRWLPLGRCGTWPSRTQGH